MIVILGLFALRISYTDLKYRKIRNPDLALLAIYILLVTSDIQWRSLLIFALLLIVFVLKFPKYLGMGDVKLIIALFPLALEDGAFLNWQLWSWTLGGIYVLALRIFRRSVGLHIPFAPFLFLGFFLAIHPN